MPLTTHELLVLPVVHSLLPQSDSGSSGQYIPVDVFLYCFFHAVCLSHLHRVCNMALAAILANNAILVVLHTVHITWDYPAQAAHVHGYDVSAIASCNTK